MKLAPPGRGSPLQGRTGRAHPRAKLSDEQVAELRRVAFGGVARIALRQTFGVSETAVRDLVTGTGRANVKLSANADKGLYVNYPPRKKASRFEGEAGRRRKDRTPGAEPKQESFDAPKGESEPAARPEGGLMPLAAEKIQKEIDEKGDVTRMEIRGKEVDVLDADPRVVLMKWDDLTSAERARFLARYPDEESITRAVVVRLRKRERP